MVALRNSEHEPFGPSYGVESPQQKAERLWGRNLQSDEPEIPQQPAILNLLEHLRPAESPAGFELASAFKKYFLLAAEIGEVSAWEEVKWLLLVNMKTLVQEEVLAHLTEPIATEIMFDGEDEHGRPVFHFRDGQYQKNVEKEAAERLKGKYRGSMLFAFLRENKLFHSVWRELANHLEKEPVEAAFPVEWLTKHGFVAEEMVVFDSVRGLFPHTKLPDKWTVWIAPQEYVFVLPNAKIHREGQTSIAHQLKLAWLPNGHFVLIDVGFMTGYRNSQMNKVFLAGESGAPLPVKSEEFFQRWELLTREFSNLAPQVLFPKLVEELGLGEERKLRAGKNVDTTSPRTYDTQLAYIKGLFEEEAKLCAARPERLQLAEELLKGPAGIVHHTLLIPRSLPDRKKMLSDYLEATASVITLAQARRIGKLLMNLAAFLDPRFFIPVQSLIDCTAGSLLGASQAGSELFAAIGVLPAELKKSQEYYRQRDITKRQELEDYCKLHKLDAKLFTENTQHKKCPNCPENMKPRYYMGPCLCWWCNSEVIENSIPAFEEAPSGDKIINSTQINDAQSSESITLSEFIYSLTAA